MPFAGSHLEICACKLPAAPVYDLVQPVVVFQRVRTNDVVVVCILQTENETAGTVHVSLYGFELHAYLQILETTLVSNEERKTIVGAVSRRLCNYIWFGRRTGIRSHYPFALGPLARPGAVEAGWHLTCLVAVEIVGLRLPGGLQRGWFLRRSRSRRREEPVLSAFHN